MPRHDRASLNTLPPARAADLAEKPTDDRPRPAPGAPAVAGARVLVLWTGHRAGAQTCRALARAGFEVVGAHPAADDGGRSRWCPRPLRYPSARREPGAFLAWLGEACSRHAIDVVLPVDEDLVRLVAERRPALGRAVTVGPDIAQYHALCDKRQLARTAAAAGVDHPGTVSVSPEGPDGPWPALPSMVKPVISQSDMSVARITIAATERERDEQVGRLLDAGLEALVQERIQGERWVGHCVRGRRGLSVVTSRIEHDYPRATGVACVQGTTESPPQLVEGIAALLGHVDYRGPATISFMRSGRRLLVHDVNLRIGASVGLMIRSGFDIPSRAVAGALGEDPPTDVTWTPVRYVWLDGEIGALIDAVRRRGASESPRAIAGRLMAAALRPDRMVDPSPVDPWWWRARGIRGTRRLARRISR